MLSTNYSRLFKFPYNFKTLNTRIQRSPSRGLTYSYAKNKGYPSSLDCAFLRVIEPWIIQWVIVHCLHRLICLNGCTLSLPVNGRLCKAVPILPSPNSIRKSNVSTFLYCMSQEYRKSGHINGRLAFVKLILVFKKSCANLKSVSKSAFWL